VTLCSPSHLGFRSPVARNTLANANAVRPWQIYADLAQHLIGIARPLYAREPIGVDLKETVYAFDATTIDLYLSVYPWAPFRSTKAAVKLHTLLAPAGTRTLGSDQSRRPRRSRSYPVPPRPTRCATR
jgi:hypothetical protein